MLKIEDKELCSCCGEGHIETLSDLVYTFSFEGVAHTISDLSHQVCDRCGTSMCSGNQLRDNHRKVSDYQSSIEVYISPSRILCIREIYDLSQENANLIFADGGTVACELLFAQWEQGRASPNMAQANEMNKAFSDKAYMCQLAQKKMIEVLEPIGDISLAMARF